jgi:riboflavin synthase
MFTGIITNLGKISGKTPTRLSVETDKAFLSGLQKGTSIAIDGICLTLVDSDKDSFTADIMPETADRTNLKYLLSGSLVNLELPATPSSLLSGHIVQGHIDGTVGLQNITKDKDSYILKFSISAALSKYIVEKGSVTLNGVSLTVIEINEDYFTVGIIPHTWRNTMFHTLKVGESVNIEVDVLAKYIDKLTNKKDMDE